MTIRATATVLVLMAAMQATLPASLSPNAQGAAGPSSRQRCGRLDVVLDKPSQLWLKGTPTRLRVMDGTRTLWKLEGAPDAPSPIMSVRCHDVTGDRAPDLLFETYSGGAHCCTTVYVVALAPPARLVLYYEAGNAGGYEVADLDKDGRSELLLGDDGLAYFADLCYACSPASMPLVACVRDARFRDCTRAYPAFMRQQITRQTQELREAQRSLSRDSFSQQRLKGAALGLYATYLLMGEDSAGWQALGTIVSSREVISWLAGHRDAVRKWAATRASRLRQRP
jgi:hypothetical protein